LGEGQGFREKWGPIFRDVLGKRKVRLEAHRASKMRALGNLTLLYEGKGPESKKEDAAKRQFQCARGAVNSVSEDFQLPV